MDTLSKIQVGGVQYYLVPSLGTGLVFEHGEVCMNLGSGLTMIGTDRNAKIGIELGSGLTYGDGGQLMLSTSLNDVVSLDSAIGLSIGTDGRLGVNLATMLAIDGGNNISIDPCRFWYEANIFRMIGEGLQVAQTDFRPTGWTGNTMQLKLDKEWLTTFVQNLIAQSAGTTDEPAETPTTDETTNQTENESA